MGDAMNALPTARETELTAALHDALMLLEGWITWKCPKKHLEEHLAELHRLHKVADPRIAQGLVEGLRVVEVKVRQTGGAYVTNTVHKQRASSTSSAQMAVEVLSGKLFDKSNYAITLAQVEKPKSHLDPEYWFIEATPRGKTPSRAGAPT
jgi:hypothetical protein